ncbi:MAG: acyl-CoA dehydrogenase [Bacteroidetes bacterium]|nr:acyl-CoA dehydrogenase family protein [Bacteroidales bacterium]RLD50211.1 MAG: acyl-CoA dehydrogenase [Bacteroidota bacterium]
MVDFSLTKEQQALVEKYKDFAENVIVPVRAKYDLSGEFPWEVVKKAYDAGLVNTQIPKKFGGEGLSIFDAQLGSEELGATCAGIGISIDANMLALTPWIIAATDEQMKNFMGEIFERKIAIAYALTEPNAGSDVAGIKSNAILKGDKYILNGHKRFITNGSASSYMTVFAQADPERGARSLSCFIVPTDAPGVEIVSDLEKMGQRGSVQSEIKFHDVEIPKANLLGREGEGFLIGMKTFDRTRTGIAALSVGIARSAYETSKEWAKNRIQFGKPVTANQGVSFMLAEMATKVELARLMTWKAAWYYEQGFKTPGTYSAMAKYYASDVAMEVTTDAVQVMGGDGYTRSFGVEKMMRDAKLCQIYEGTNQVQRLVISKGILR